MSTKADLIHDLFEAVNNKQVRRVAELLDEGANPDLPIGYLKGQEREPFNALTMALMTQQVDMFQLMLEKGADPLVTHPKTHDTLLHVAMAIRGRKSGEITQRSLEMAKLLLDHGVPVDCVNTHGVTPLEDAVVSDEPKLVQLLMEYGANPFTRNFNGEPIIQAAKTSRPECYQVMLDWLKRFKDGIFPIFMVDSSSVGMPETAMSANDCAARADDEMEDRLTSALKAATKRLWAAIESGDAIDVEIVIERGASAKMVHESGLPLIHFCWQTYASQPSLVYFEILDMLCAEGLDLDAVDTEGETTLCRAARVGDPDWIAKLLGLGADFKRGNPRGIALEQVRESPDGLHALCYLMMEERYWDELVDHNKITKIDENSQQELAKIEALLHSGQATEAQQQSLLDAALVYAVMASDYAAVKSLVERGASVNSSYAPIKLAAGEGNSVIVEYLINNGADIFYQDRHGCLLHHAFQLRNWKVRDLYHIFVSLLKKGINANIQDANGDTPLHFAARQGKPLLVKLLLESGADAELKNKDGFKAYQMIGKNDGHVETKKMMDWFSECSPQTAITAKFLMANDGLMKAVENGDIEMMESLLANGVNIHDARASHFLNPVQFAVSKGRKDSTEWLLSKGADRHCRDMFGQSLLHHALLFPDEGRCLEMIRLIVTPDFEINARDQMGYTALHKASMVGFALVSDYLLTHGADSEMTTNDMETVASLIKHAQLDVKALAGEDSDFGQNATRLTKIEAQAARLKDSLLQLSERLKSINKGYDMGKPADAVDSSDIVLSECADELSDTVKRKLIDLFESICDTGQNDQAGVATDAEKGGLAEMDDQDFVQYIYGQVCANYTSGMLDGLDGRDFDFDQPLDEHVLSVLDMAVCLGCVDIFDALLVSGANADRKIRGRSLLNETLRYCQYEGAAVRLVQRMLDFGFDPNETDDEGLSLIQLACRRHWYRVVMLLAKRGATHIDLLTESIIKGAEEWGIAEQRRRKKLTKATSLHEDLWDAIRSKCWPDAEKAIARGACINGIGDEQPLRLAIVTGNVDAFLGLLKYEGLELDKTNFNGETYLHACVQYEKGLIGRFMAEKLIQRQAIDIDRQDNHGNTALMWAVLSNNVYMIWALCHKGFADPSVKNVHQQSAIAFARKARSISKEHQRVSHMLDWSMARQDAKANATQYKLKSAEARQLMQFVEMPGDDYEEPDFMERCYGDNGLLTLFQVKEDSKVFAVYQSLLSEALLPEEERKEDAPKALSPERSVEVSEALLKVYDIKQLEKLTKSEDKEYSKFFATLSRNDNGFRVLQRIPDAFYARLAVLKDNFPNMLPFLEYVERNASLSDFRKHRSMYLPPVILVSKPGLGKTECVKKVAELLSVPFHFVDFSTATANWIMSGSSASWKDAKSGMVFNSCVKGEIANPLFLCDEIDKSGGDQRYPAINVFHTLLEKGMAKTFNDEFYPELKIDASHIMYVATANSLDPIPEPIISRFHVIEIQEPTREQMPAIIHSVYSSILSDEGYEVFPESLSDEVVACMLDYTPRQVKAVLNQAFANAAYRMMGAASGSIEVEVGDLGLPSAKNKRSIGFVHHG